MFSNFGMKIFLAGGGSGKGMAVNNKTKAETFMKMVEVQAGLGIGVKKFRLVWVFQNKSDFDAFVNSGWEIGAQAERDREDWPTRAAASRAPCPSSPASTSTRSRTTAWRRS